MASIATIATQVERLTAQLLAEITGWRFGYIFTTPA
jgi:hypothetical protein